VSSGSKAEPAAMFTPIRQVQALLGFLFLLYSLPSIFLCAVAVIGLKMDVPMYMFMRDPAAILHAHPLTGVVSNLGVLFWSASAAICFFTWSILRQTLADRFPIFFLWAGLLTSLLLLDDFFQFHDAIFPHYFHVPEKLTYLSYVVFTVCLIVAFRKCILRTDYIISLSALCFFALSVGVDVVQDHIEPFLGQWRILFEDGFKFLGIVGWFGYFFRTCFVAIASARDRSTPTTP